MTVTVSGFRIGTLSDLLGYAPLQGQVSGSLALSGDGQAPRVEVSVQSSLEASATPPSEVDLTATYAQGSMDLDASATMEGGAGFHARGTLPMKLSLADSAGGLVDGDPVEMAFSADSLPLSWVGLFLPERSVRDLSGVLDGSVDLSGQSNDPVLEGAVNLTRLNVGLPRLGVRYDGGKMALRLHGDQVILDSLRLRTDKGALMGSGTVTIAQLDHPEYDLALEADAFRAIRSSGVDITTSGRLQVSGTGFKPVVEGRLEVLRGEVYLGDLASASDVEGVTLTEEDYRELARVFGYRSVTRSTPGPNLFDSTTIDVDVALRRDSWIRQRANPQLAVQFTGDLSVRKAPGDSIRLVGEVDGIPERSYVEQFGRRFSLANATVTFQGPPAAAQVDLRAEYEVPSRDNPDQPEVVIALDVTGTPENLNLELSSTPPLEASDMVSYLAVGQPASRTLGGGESSLSQTGGALALGRLSSAVETYAREQVGLDVVEITTDGLDGVTLLAGRYVSPDLYLGIRQPISLQRSSADATERPQEPQFEIELQAVRWLLLNLQAGGQGDTKVFVRSRISYD
jgi:translocation and assembly module TamB